MVMSFEDKLIRDLDEAIQLAHAATKLAQTIGRQLEGSVEAKCFAPLWNLTESERTLAAAKSYFQQEKRRRAVGEARKEAVNGR